MILSYSLLLFCCATLKGCQILASFPALYTHESDYDDVSIGRLIHILRRLHARFD